MTDIVIGCDPSSKKLACTVISADGRVIEAWRKFFPDDYDLARKCDYAEVVIRKLVKRYVDKGFRVWFFVEDPVVGPGPRATIIQSQVRGGILIGAHRGGAAEIQGANNNTWKKQVLGHGKFTKAQIPREVKRLWPRAYEMFHGDPDGCDSACIAEFGRKVLINAKKIEKRK